MNVPQLLKLARSHKKPAGTINWELILEYFPKYSKQELQNTLYNFMRSNKWQTQDLRKNYKWSAEEKNSLLKMVQQFGKDWKKINAFFAERSVAQIKNQYFQLLSKGEIMQQEMIFNGSQDSLGAEESSFHLDQFSLI
ncbi:Myb-like DNA-binding domain-containing protein [Spironucleus salmonicida]|uniref:Myb-like DNA-binding domain-containing protein n=1 Tax=Spironucleus salmonicida TaxID=348837 RepID=V6LLK3_9EUKA|nr:Myb-like DNA-binding domain-containing protein [Spironucleus salmonicida]KAH0569650.1 Myb-like DNA-binding domain-containing protein [Spironucleus salmonicida]|eukprot:EST41574.1 Myb-like DNA-binding domain-containing protein [Spironucleus salmonicida]